MKPLIKNYREDLISDVVEMKSYNRRAALGDLGVRIQISIGVSSPTERQAISNITIAKAIDDGVLDEEFFEDIDDPQELIRRVTVYHRVSSDYETFKSKLDTLEPADQMVLKPYLLKQKSINDLAAEMEIEYRSAVMKIYRIKKKLCIKMESRLKRGVKRNGIKKSRS